MTNRERNELLNREELELSLEHQREATPSENTVRSQLAAELDLDPKTVQINHIYSSSGSTTSTAEVTVFDEPIMEELPDEDETEDGEEAAEEDAEADEATEEDESEDTEADDAEEAVEDEDSADEEAEDETDEPDADEDDEPEGDA